MSNPTPTTPKGPRNTRRHPKRMTTPISQATIPMTNGKTTPPQLSPPTPGYDVSIAYDSANALSEGGLRRKKGRPVKKPWDSSKSSSAKNTNDNASHRHTSSQPSVKSPLAIRDSPHYAGPTFHASPAPSALPVPSFASKSVPESDSPLQVQMMDDSSNTDSGDSTPTKARTVPLPQEEDKNVTSPLDFLFKAAREANNGSASSERSGNFSSTTSLPLNPERLEVPQDPETASGAVFPLELDVSESRISTPDSKMMAIGPSFAASYKERMNALRSASSPSSPGDITALNEEERKAKAEALKNLLLNPSQRCAASASLDQCNSARLFSPQSNINTNHPDVTRRISSSSTPLSFERTRPKTTASSDRSNSIPHQYLASICGGAPTFPSPSPNARKEASSAFRANHGVQATRAHSAHSTFYGNYISPPPNRTVSALASGTQSVQGLSTRLDPLETKRIEDDLRRILKLNGNDVHNVNGIEQTLA
ncbi:hypothetical protein PRK78_001941 [Emydomyces testavorans]|uniref:Proteophosphoglycan 5 n=1 Tax=Emydomyces testavorans TaxID=2070801 RepID=A0AAF0DF10_9EURO|nr:hypothetical protein PRK78_001941 [Emydomyces testavorans]